MFNMEKQFCNNCGNFGHVYGNCRHPILSYGIILFNIDEENVPSIVMVERKDSLSYIEFIRGKYNIDNRSYIQLLLSRMTLIEKEKLLNNSFDDLWKLLWIHIDNVNQRIKKEYMRSKATFEKLKNGYTSKDKKTYNLELLVKEIKHNYENNEWEIPKGRRSGNENNKDCALREFEEETNISKDSYTLIKNIIPLIEEYKGINNVRYKHIYYIGRIDQKQDLIIDKTNKDQYTEIKTIEWLKENECYEKIRPYNEPKKKIINTFFQLYRNIYENNFLELKSS
jgi:8-oxo-dGTP pyrophosphatase MutT (NUDIX family)